MTTYAVQGPAHAGAQITLSAPSGTTGDFAPTGVHQGLLVSNGNGGAISVVLPIVPTYDGLAVANRVVTIPGTANTLAGVAQFEIIPLPNAVYGVAPTPVQYSAICTTTVAAITIP